MLQVAASKVVAEVSFLGILLQGAVSEVVAEVSFLGILLQGAVSEVVAEVPEGFCFKLMLQRLL